MNNPNTNPEPDVLKTDLQRGQLSEIKEAVTWCLADIVNSSSNIQDFTTRARPNYKNKVLLQRAVADLRDVSSKLQEIEQYMSQ